VTPDSGPCPNTFRFLMGRARHAMSADDRRIVEDMVGEIETIPGEHVVLHEKVLLDRSTMLIEGFLARTVETEGRQHVIALHFPGDFVDLHAFPLKRLDHNIVAIGSARVGYVPHARLEEVLEESPHLTRLLWFSTMLDAAIHRAWIAALERLNADGRLAHLLLETWYRLRMVGLAEESGFAFPLTQVELADACGTTAVHLNRVVRSLREAGLVDIARGRVTILDRKRLERIASFDPAYLYGSGSLQLHDELTIT